MLSVKSRLATEKTLITFLKLVKMILTNTHPVKKYIRGNNKPLMTKAYSKAIMQGTRFRNKFLKNPTDLNKVLYNKRRNYCVSLLRKGKKRILCKIK